MPTPLPDLPIVEVLPELLGALAGRGRAVLSAPPGAGKTTVVPLAVLDVPWLGVDRRIVVLEPRRLATRAAARRMADLLHEPVGRTVGYQTRDERRIGATTRIEVVTEGVLTRRLQNDPELPGVGLVVFDEFHERNLTTDLGLALTLDAAATLRPDLRLLAMSATADTRLFATLLGGPEGDVPIVTSEGRTHPIDVRWVPRRREDRLEPAMASAIRRALTEEPGDVLAFLPGIGEINRTADLLRGVVGDDVDVHRLAGAVPTDEQDRALADSPAGRRRVVLATDIAETSLTVAGVRVVVDGGVARAPRFDVGTGMTRLTTVAISRDSADQRAGRAGRTEPGVAYRLWSKIEHGTRPAHRAAEITHVDLAGLVLELAAWGSPAGALSFVDPPPPRALKQGGELLVALDAIDADGAITAIGRSMVALPVHPRLARMIVGRGDTLACVVAAAVDERDVLRGRPDTLPADLALRVGLVCGQLGDDRADRGAIGRVRERAADIASRAGVAFAPHDVNADAAGDALLLGFPDRLAGRRRPGQFQLRTGSGAWLPPTDPLADAPFVVAADLDGKRTGARIRLAAAIDPIRIAETIAAVKEERRLEWDVATDDLVLRVERRLDALRLGEERSRAEPGDDAAAALVDRVRTTKLSVLPWTTATTQVRARTVPLAATDGDRWPDLSDRALLSSLDDWLAPYLAGATSRADLERLDLGLLLRALLPWPLGVELDELAPIAWTRPDGRSSSIDYTADRPTVSVRVQDVFGVTTHPTVVRGTVPLTLALLSPADRPIQVTADLPRFWKGSWQTVRKELAGRYPKHRWPEDPSSSSPGRLKRPSH